MVATNFDVGIITTQFNWSLLGLKQYNLDFCLSCASEGFLYNITEGLPLGSSTGKLLNSALCSRYGIARGAYSSGSGSSGTPLWTLEASKHRLLGIHVGCHEEPNKMYPNIYIPATVLRQLLRYCSGKHGRSASAKTCIMTKEQNPIFHLAAIRYDRNTGRIQCQRAY